jgi:hypothetical protein
MPVFHVKGRQTSGLVVRHGDQFVKVELLFVDECCA